MITVRELILLLAECDMDAVVIMSKDGEGNGYSPFGEVETSYWYQPSSTYSGDLTDDPEEAGPDTPACVVLWPAN